MRERRAASHPRAWWLLAVALVVGPLAPVGAEAADAGEADGPLVRTTEPVRFVGGPDTVVEVDDGRRLLDTVEIRLGPEGESVLVNELSMDDYVSGLAEMPPRWHEEALRAQAVAARTYAWRAIERGTFRARGLGYDICATVACQVFSGASAVEDRVLGERWRAAVEETSGEALVDDGGQPILARYFSSSGGRSLPNELVFPEEGPRPYLVGTEDPDDEVSPLHRWEVRFSRAAFDDVLSRGETLGAAVPVAEVERDGPVVDPYAEIVVTGADGTRAAVPAVTFREFVSRVAAERHPGRFPGPHPRGFGRLPTTLPSSRFTVEVTDDEVVVRGRGWGHGVGMSQYGARGKALRGLDHAEILASYYDGLAPSRPEDVPDRVRVGLDAAATTTVRGEGPLRLTVGERVLAEEALGAWEVAAEAGELVVTAPAGWGEPLTLSPTRVTAGGAGDADHVVVEVEVDRPARLVLRVRQDGRTVLERAEGIVDAGTHRAVWRYRDAEGEPVAAGTYRVELLGTTGDDEVVAEPVAVEVAAPARRGTTTSDDGGFWGRGGRGLVPRLAALGAAAVLVGVAVAARRRRRA